MINFWTKLKKPFTVLAPMEGVTDFTFREIVATALPKPDVLFTEFTNVDALNSEGFERTIPRFKFSKVQRPIVAQIWGTNPENFFESAKLISSLGFDGIDINMGCPDRAVTKIGAGAKLINNNSQVKEIIEATKKGANKLSISIKTRLGFKVISTEEWISFLLEQKLDAISIHGRTAKELSLVNANWDEIKKAVNLKNKISPNTIIIGNGDVKSYSEVLLKSKEYDVDGVMIGRGIFTNPWVFDKKIKVKHEFNDYKNVLIRHLKLIDNDRNYNEFKKFYKMYVNNFSGAHEIRAKLMMTKSVSEALKLLK